ncbi:telomere stability and silencing-domain-containing protein [Peziza echinospora]|nr:telomere stability and silencing-domain-containing protein [Peziza echinospora]
MIVNALVTTFHGLPNLSIPLPSSASISELHSAILTHLPPTLPYLTRLLLSTSSGKILSAASPQAISTLIQDAISSNNNFIPLRLTPPLPGGKGGFGSQLRAAGGRMSSRKKRGQEENSDSCRNLDGRRIRTVKEAKALAAYLEIKPEMERKEKEARRERWMKIVETADRREQEEKGGAVLGGKRFEDVEWLEKNEEEKERLREMVAVVMKDMMKKEANAKNGGPSDEGSSGASSGEEGDQLTLPTLPKLIGKVLQKPVPTLKTPKFSGFDDDDEFMSDEEMEDIDEEDEEEEIEAPVVGKGKGKAKA